MGCGALAFTGTPLTSIMSTAVLVLLAGIALLLLAARRRTAERHRGVTAVIVLLALGLSLVSSRPASAATVACDTLSGADVHVDVQQTSLNTDLAPGAPASTIVGVVNNPTDKTIFVNSVTVSIAGVTKSASAASGTCDSSDFVLTDITMPVGLVVAPGGSAPFAGALISFNDKSVDQDACKGATVTLTYASD